MGEKICISDLTLDALTAYIVGLGQPKFRAKQIFKWLHQKLVTEFSQMTDQPKALLAQLEEQCTIAAPVIRRRQQSRDGTVKYLLQLADGNCIETVLMRYKYGNTVCVSTQVGCAMGCRFCASTQAGRVRDLTAGEIAAEIYTAQKDTGERVSHIVLMGIGEPLHNFNNVMDFLEIISCPEGVNIGMRNISLSTCGLVPKIDELAKRHLQLTLSVSLHAPDNKTRSGMMPVNDAFPLEQLIPACRRYQKETGRRISFEYSMVRGVNDSSEMAQKLANLIKGMGAHVNLIPINPVDGSPYSATDDANVHRFQKELEALGVNATVRRRLGTDISAACGQLRREDAENESCSATEQRKGTNPNEDCRDHGHRQLPAGKPGQLLCAAAGRRHRLGHRLRRHGRCQRRAHCCTHCHRHHAAVFCPPHEGPAAWHGKDFPHARVRHHEPRRV